MTGRRATWPETDLIRRLCSVLEIASNAVRRLAVDGFTDVEEPANNVRPEKVISESALLLYAASTVSGHDEIAERVREVAALLLPHARSERMLLGICTEPALACDYAFAHACLKRIGYPEARFDAALDAAGRSQARQGRERPPHRMIEWHWVLRSCRGTGSDGEAPADRVPSAVRQSVLRHPMDLLSGSREDVYAFTHALMYTRDFNVQPWPLPRPRKAVLAEAEAALARCLDEQDYDLAGEVLLAWPLTGKSWSDPASFAFSVLADIEDQAGFLPSPGTKLDRLSMLAGEDRARYLIATAYHTAYVMGLLCAAALQPGRAPPEKIGSKAGNGSSRALLEMLSSSENQPHWVDHVERLADQERDALAGLFFTIGLRRSVLQRDFNKLHQLLAIGHDAGLTDSPSASQAAEVLETVAAHLA